MPHGRTATASIDETGPLAREAGIDPRRALERGARALVAKQAADGSWEGEVVWSPMLAAQLVLAHHLMSRPIEPERRRRILLHFEKTRLPSGTWGLSEWSEPSLFVTTLVYVAARVLGEAPEGPLLGRALELIRREGAASIPSWGKFWLALLNLYAWEGVNPISPEIWDIPRFLPLHPSRYYCHTRLIYLGMAALYGARFTAPRTPLVDALRRELYVNGYEAVDFAAALRSLRPGDLYAPPSAALRASYRVLGWIERVTSPARRQRSLSALRVRIRHELATTDHTSISPVSGLLNILALWSASPGATDEDVEQALLKLDRWIWEDDVNGARVTGARSTTWDTAFAVQALAEATPHTGVRAAVERGDRFLDTQQIRRSIPDAAAFDRADPVGGFCFAEIWHGWPVSDCTAEAILARLASPYTQPDAGDVASAVRFILRSQNDDGGFGSYERRRSPVSLEWLNPAEMFGDSMTEASYVECTASCIAALARARPLLPRPAVVDTPIARAVARLRASQHAGGSWQGAWGVRLVYGTMFGIRGLVAGGVSPHDAQIRKAAGWLRSHQRSDGGWGEAHVPAPTDRYRQAEESQVIQTAWALSALIEAEDPDHEAQDRAARFLARAQKESGDWPDQAPAGVFFHTALLDYKLYKSYFPVLALAQYETRRARHAGRVEPGRAASAGRSDVMNT